MTNNTLLSIFIVLILGACGDGGGSSSTGTGVSGSAARFAIVGDYLYLLNQYKQESSVATSFAIYKDSLDTYSLAVPDAPERVNRLEAVTDFPETLHASGANLFIGSQIGMQIISLEDPTSPVERSFTRHFNSRDPVVVVDNRAYVTLRAPLSDPNFTQFQTRRNELQVFDVTDLDNPARLSVFSMTSPWGVGVVHDRAYICDGSAGLRVLSVHDPEAITEVAANSLDICFDVIATDSLLISTGASGVNQYKIEKDSPTPQLLSTIKEEAGSHE